MTTAKRAALAVALLAIATSALAQSERDFRWTGRVDAGQTLEIKNANGPILAELADGDEIEVVATLEGPRGDIEEVSIDVVEHDGGVTLCSIYPGGWLRDNECAPGRGGRVGSSDNDTTVTFRLRVPAGVRLVGVTMNGRVDIDDLRSDVQVETMNGRMNVSTTGWASAKTMNGAVEVTMGDVAGSGDIEVSSMNGAITVNLPRNASVDVSASTMNGSIDSDWPLEISGWLRNKGRGQIGDGGRRLEMSTMNGGIRLRRAS